MAEPLTPGLVEHGSTERTRRLQALDWVRFIAAASVVAFHYLFNGVNDGSISSVGFSPASSLAKYGYLGVELFFLISGFVIANSARGKPARKFVVGRALRLYPAFWVAVLLTSAVIVVLGSTRSSVRPMQVLANLTMVHQLLGQPSVDDVYWSLFLELQFYAVVALALLLGLGRRLHLLFPLWAIAMLLVGLLAPSLADSPLLGGYWALFVSGAVIATIRERGHGWLASVGLVAGYVVAIRFVIRDAEVLAASKSVILSPVVVGVILTVCYLVLLSFCVSRVAALHLPGSRRAGALTYPIYLLHGQIGYAVIAAVGTPTNKWWVYGGTVALVMAAAWLINRFVEEKWHSFWVRFFDRTVGAVAGAVERVGRPLAARSRPLGDGGSDGQPLGAVRHERALGPLGEGDVRASVDGSG